MSERSLTDADGTLAPEAAFGVLANESRLAIIEALWKAEETPVTFSNLRRAVGMSDSAQFNYHLDKLRGQFVRKTDEGYELSYAGRAVIQAVVSGTFNEKPEIAPFPVEGTCRECDGPLQAEYADEMFTISCAECDHDIVRYPFPPGGLVDRSGETLVRAFDQRLRHFHCLVADGVCPHCGGIMDMSLAVDGDAGHLVSYQCQRCDIALSTTAGMTVLDHVEVVAFHRDHGVDLNEELVWTLPWVTDEDAATVESTDPWRLSLSIELDDQRLDLLLDGDLDVVESDRVPLE